MHVSVEGKRDQHPSHVDAYAFHTQNVSLSSRTEDPLYRDNEKAYAWVCQDGWTYSTTVDLHDLKARHWLAI